MASSAQSPLRERPIQFGKYALLARIASGGMGELYLAQLRSAGGFAKLVVIKRILSHLTDKQEFVDMFVAEARTAARISHPNVCQIYELGQVDGRYYMALEYLEGLPLADVMVARKRAPQMADLRFIVSLVSQTAEGLHHAHSLRDPDGEDARVVHRDVNPRNVFVTSAGVAKVLDFGIVKVRGALSQVQTDSVRGTYSYMAPEQLQGESVEATADIFSLGTMTWEAVVGRRLFKRSSDLLTWRAIVEEPIPRPKQFRPDLSPELDDAIMRALCRPVEERFQTAREFATALEQAIRPLGAPLTTLAVAAEMEKAFATELAAQRERVFAAHRREDQPVPEAAPQPVADEISEDNSGPIEDWFGRGSDTRVADPGYAELVAKMAKARSQEIPVPGLVSDPPSEEIILTEVAAPDLLPLQPASTGATTQDWRPVSLPRPSRLPAPPPMPAHVDDDLLMLPETEATAPSPAVTIVDEESIPIRLRPRRRWLMALALAVSAATGAALVLVLNRDSGEEAVAEQPAAEVAGSVVAGGRAGEAEAADEAADEAAVAEATAPATVVEADAAKLEREAAAKLESEAAEREREAAARLEREAAEREAAAKLEREAVANEQREAAEQRERDRSREKKEKREAKRERRAEKAAAARAEKPQRQRGVDKPRERNQLADVLPAVTPDAAGKEGGFLTINTEPYATVFVDGKKRGFTPVVRLALPPGAHNLRLVSSAGQPDKKMRVRIVAGQELRKFVKW